MPQQSERRTLDLEGKFSKSYNCSLLLMLHTDQQMNHHVTYCIGKVDKFVLLKLVNYVGICYDIVMQ